MLVGHHADGTVYWETIDQAIDFEPAPQPAAAEPAPEIPPPVWDARPINPEACAAATRALCG